MTERFPVASESTILVPINKPCWLVWDHATELDGPYDCLAAVSIIETESVPGKFITETRKNLTNNRIEESARTDYDPIPKGVTASLDYPTIYFFVLPEDPSNWESLWIEQKYIAFSAVEAELLLGKRRLPTLPGGQQETRE